MFETFFRSGRSLAATGVHVLIIAVPEYEAVFDRYPLTSATVSYSTLGKFWKRAAEAPREAGFHCEAGIAQVAGLRLQKGPTFAAREILIQLHEVLSALAPTDALVVHWIGHGSYMKKVADHVMYLPNIEAKNNLQKLEGFWLKRLTDFVGSCCRARTQLFFVDCCSTAPASEEQTPTAFPGETINVPRGPKQFILVGSGYDRATRGRDNEPSIFTNSLLAALTKYAGDENGTVATGYSLIRALAAAAKGEWITKGYSDYPKGALRTGAIDWTQEFVQQVQPFCRHLSSQANLRIGTAGQQLVHSCIAFQGSLKGSGFSIESSSPELVLFDYEDGERALVKLTASMGDLCPNQAFKVMLTDAERREIKVVAGSAIPPATHEWL